MKRRVTCFLGLVLVLLGTTGCLEKIPTEYTINTEIDTGRDLKNLVDDALADLQEAEQIAGEEARQTIQDAISQLEDYSIEIIETFGGQLDRTIQSLDAILKEKLIWIQIYTEQVHEYALSIIHAAGEEARETIQEAALGMRRTIVETELSAQRTTVIATQNVTFIVDTVAERSIAIFGLVTGLIFVFVSTFGWGRLIYTRRIPTGSLQRILAMGLLMMSFFFSFLPFITLIPPVRAYALSQVGKASVVGYAQGETASGPTIPKGVPRVYEFVPDQLIVPIITPTPQTLTIVGANLLAMGTPSVTYGGLDLVVIGYTEDHIEVDISPVSDQPGLARSIEVKFGSGKEIVQYAVPVYEATAMPTIETTVEPTTGFVIIAPDKLKPVQGIIELRSIPDVAGLAKSEAEALLANQGVIIEETRYEISQEIGKGLAIRTDPPAGTTTMNDAAKHLKLYISRGPICEIITKEDTRTDSVEEVYHPPLTRGDSEFGGNGPDVIARVTLFIESNAVKAKIYMRAEETKNDHSTAEGSTILTIFEPPAGYEVLRILGNTFSEVYYRDSNHSAEVFTRPSEESVYQFEIIGDTSGSDVGQRDGDTGVTVYFREIEVELMQTANCAAAQVEVHFDKLEIQSMDPNACAMTVDFYVGDRMLTWSPPLKPEVGVFGINQSLNVTLTEGTPLIVNLVGSYSNRCSPTTLFNGNLGRFQVQFPSTNDWSSGSRTINVTIPYNLVYYYVIRTEWLP